MVQFVRLSAIALSAVMLLFAAPGCGDADVARLAVVRGRVTYQGKTLTSGTIVFAPDALRGNNGPLATAAIQPDGSFDLHTGEALGAMPGWHRVTVVALEAGTGGQALAVPRSLLPDKYSDPDLSGLTCEVKPAQENSVAFDLD
ncbi:MAG TPA: hypothetical protein VKI65_00475 [Gemmataceae bacterium]|nr:hypothetical protein [Gemmataceae bacterium]